VAADDIGSDPLLHSSPAAATARQPGTTGTTGTTGTN
jgi:hypothetical protein